MKESREASSAATQDQWNAPDGYYQGGIEVWDRADFNAAGYYVCCDFGDGPDFRVAEDGRKIELILTGVDPDEDWDLDDLYPPSAGAVSVQPTPGGDPLEPSALSTWTPIDLGPYLDGSRTRPLPTVGRREHDGACLFYAGRLNVIFGEPESGKSWLMLAVLAERMLEGENVALIDYEDGPDGAVERLRVLGVPDDVVLSLLRYVTPEVKADRFALAALVSGCSVVGIDATTEAMSIEEKSSNSDVDVAAFYATLPKAVARLGPAVLLIDHVTKAWEGQNQQTGSQHKRAGVDGTSVKVECADPFVPGGGGMSRIIVTKDRNGAVREKSHRIGTSRNAQFADFYLPAEGGWTLDLAVPIVVKTKEEKDYDKVVKTKIAVTKVAEIVGVPLKSCRETMKALTLHGEGTNRGNVKMAMMDSLVAEGYLTTDYGFIKRYGDLNLE